MKIKIKAIGVNRADVFYRQGKYPAFGLEVAGLADDGRRIMAIVDGGGYAQEIEVEDGSWLEMPDGMDFVEAASIIEALYTCYYNLVTLCRLKAGEDLLIHGGASGIGVVGIQLAQMLGANVAATAGKPAKLELIGSLGALALDYNQPAHPALDAGAGAKTHQTPDQVRGVRFGENKYDVILDMVGAEYFNDNLAALKMGGRLAIIAFIGGAKCEAKLGALLLKNLSVYGSTVRSLSPAVKAKLRDGIAPFVGRVKPVVDRVYGFKEINKALDYVEAYKNIGKVVVVND